MAERKNAVMSYSFDEVTRVHTWTFGGKIPDVVLDESKLTGSILAQAATHGLKQKGGDAAALGQNATAEEKADAMRAVIENLNAGRWNAVRGEGDAGTFLARAIVEHTGKPLAAVREWLAGKKPAERAAIAALEPYAGLIAGYRKARVSTVDVEAAMEGLDEI